MVDLLQNKYTRREALKLMAIGTGIPLTLGGSHLARPIFDQLTASFKANFSNSWFLKENKDKLRNLEIGGSFSPEQAFYISNGENEKDNSQELLRIIVKELNIKDLRLGIRWSETMFKRGKVEISSYKPYIDYCLENGVNLCLNVGPIKTFRWPEQHIPYFLKDILPPNGATITPNMEIAKEATDYLDLLLYHLTAEYRTDLQNKTPIIQVENESSVPYGEYGWTMRKDYLQQVTNIAKQHFPNSKFLFNTGLFMVEPISNLLNQLNAYNIKTIYGLDYYFNIDDHTNSKNWIIQLPFINHLDLLTLSKIFGQPLWPDNVHPSNMEITEGQFEGWGRYQDPGNSVKEFRYLLLRCMDDIFNADTKYHRLIRLWGLEAFAQKIFKNRLSDDHKNIIELIQAINHN